MFLTAGTIEGFVTGAPAIPAAAKVALGLTVWAAFLAYVTIRGRAAAAAGFTGSLEELRPSWSPPDARAVLAPGPRGPKAWSDDPLAGADRRRPAADNPPSRWRSARTSRRRVTAGLPNGR